MARAINARYASSEDAAIEVVTAPKNSGSSRVRKVS
jgi:hypothetical protein